MAIKLIKADSLIQEYFSKFSKFGVNVIAKSCSSKVQRTAITLLAKAVPQETAISYLLTSLENRLTDLVTNKIHKFDSNDIKFIQVIQAWHSLQ